MALDAAPLLRKQSVVAFALETTTGTAATIAGTDGVTNIFNADTTPETEIVKRQSQGVSISPIRQGLGAKHNTISFETELVGNGATGLPAWALRLLIACGYQNTSGVFTPLTGQNQTITINHYIAGRLRQMVGCMGTFTLTLKRGQAGMFKWTFTGVPNVPTETALISPTYSTIIAPQCGLTTFTVGAVTGYRVDEVVFDAGNTVILRQDASAVDSSGNATGYRCAAITDRNPMVKISPEALSLTTKDWNAVFRNSTMSALNCVAGATANNTFALTAPDMQVHKDPKDGDRDGLLTDQLEFLCTRNAGDDEISLALT